MIVLKGLQLVLDQWGDYLGGCKEFLKGDFISLWYFNGVVVCDILVFFL